MISFKAIVESGVAKSDVYQRRRSILLSNYIALILCGAIILLSITRFLLFHDIDQTQARNYFLGFILFSATTLLNRLRLTTLSRLYLSVLPIAYLWYIYIASMKLMPTIDTSIYDSLRIFLLALSCIPYLILDKKQFPVFVVGILPALISIVLLEYLLGFVGLDHVTRGVPEFNYQYIQMRTIVSYLVISSCCIVFQIIIQRNDEFNQRLLAQLKVKSDEIAAQNEELLQSEENLNMVNQHLESLVEERTKKIREQNEVMLKYAFTNAHHVRGSVARVLGLIQVTRLKTDLDFPWFFEKVEHEVKEIDLILKRIASDFAS
jgi:hypothetical protein